jgi:hypothetical protein
MSSLLSANQTGISSIWGTINCNYIEMLYNAPVHAPIFCLKLSLWISWEHRGGAPRPLYPRERHNSVCVERKHGWAPEPVCFGAEKSVLPFRNQTPDDPTHNLVILQNTLHWTFHHLLLSQTWNCPKLRVNVFQHLDTVHKMASWRSATTIRPTLKKLNKITPCMRLILSILNRTRTSTNSTELGHSEVIIHYAQVTS